MFYMILHDRDGRPGQPRWLAWPAELALAGPAGLAGWPGLARKAQLAGPAGQPAWPAQLASQPQPADWLASLAVFVNVTKK